MKDIPIGHRHEETVVVDKTNIASAVGSGLVDVYATPMMVALLELAASNCVKEFLDDGEVTVGAEIEVNHSAPTPVGMKVTAAASVKSVDRRRIDFIIEVTDEAGEIGAGTHVRYVVDKAKFMAKAEEKKANLA